MQPTMKLRYVWGSEPAPEYGENVARKVKVLQQWWEEEFLSKESWDSTVISREFVGEWRDVPIETD